MKQKDDRLFVLSVVKTSHDEMKPLCYSHDIDKLRTVSAQNTWWVSDKYKMGSDYIVNHTDEKEYPQYFIHEVPFVI